MSSLDAPHQLRPGGILVVCLSNLAAGCFSREPANVTKGGVSVKATMCDICTYVRRQTHCTLAEKSGCHARDEQDAGMLHVERGQVPCAHAVG